MSDNIINEKTEAVSNPTTPTLDYILSRIDLIINDNMHVHDAIDAIKNLLSPQGPNYAGDSRGEAIANTIQAREMTNQRLIGLLEKMYDDLRPAKKSDDIVKFQQLTDALCRYPQDVAVSTIQKAVQQMFVHAGAGIVK